MQDLRLAIRQLRKSPGFAAAAVLMLALGIGAGASMIGIADAVLLRPLPYPNAGRLVLVWNELSKIGVRQLDLSPQDFDAFRATGIFETSAAFKEQDRNLTSATSVRRVSTLTCQPGLFAMLGARFESGRSFTETDGPAVAVVRRSAAVGQSIRLDDRLYTVVGVLSRDFEFSLGSSSVEVWTPLPPLTDRGRRQVRLLGRLRPGIDRNAAQDAIGAAARHLKETYHVYEGPHGEDAGYTASVIPLRDQLLQDFRTATLAISMAVGLLLLIVTVNVSNLLLARTIARQKEIAIRMAIGASRFRLSRQWLVEAGLLTALGTIAGLGLSLWAVRLLLAWSPMELPAPVRIGIDARAVQLTAAVALLVCLLSSVAPISTVVRLRGPARRGTSNALIAAEVAFALLLLIGSGLLVKTFQHLKAIDSGIRTDHVLTMLLSLPGGDRSGFFAELEQRLSNLPGVVSAATTDRLPVFTVGADTRNGNPFSIDGSAWDPNGAERQIAHTGTVSIDYFRTMGIPLLEGRTFHPSDQAGAPLVAVINQTLARRFFRGTDPLGRRILLGAPEPGAKWLTIVGVIGDVRTGALDLSPMPQFYVPEAQSGNGRRFLVIRTASDPLSLARTASEVVRGMAPGIPVEQVSTMQERVDKAMGRPRFCALLLSFFGVAGLLLAAAGTYSVVAHEVARRTWEIGIRMALGAAPRQVLRATLVRALRPVVVGAIVGLVATAWLVRFLSSLLYQVRPGDAVTWIGSASLLMVAAVIACLVPATRAARVDPMVALRYE